MSRNPDHRGLNYEYKMPHSAMLGMTLAALSFDPCTAFFHTAAGIARHARVQTSAISMGGPSGLPRIPQRALPLTKSFNPEMKYNLDIATLWRDLEITYGTEDSPNEELAFRAAKRCPSLLNPAEQSRWVFFSSKDLLMKATGDEQAAIKILSQDPTLLSCAKYDGLNPKLEAMLQEAGVNPSMASTGPGGGGLSPTVALGGVGLAAAAAAFLATQQ